MLVKSEITSLNGSIEAKLDQEKKELSKDKKNTQLRAKLQLVQDALKTLGDTEYIIKSKIR